MPRARHLAPVLCALCLCLSSKVSAIDITVDYRYDSNGFFDPNTSNGQQARAALQAVADRFSTIITSSLGAAVLTDEFPDARIGFTHPGTGAFWQVSSASNEATDSLAANPINAADEYRGPWTINQDEWILYAGGRPISSAGAGGTGTGLNWTSVFTDNDSVLNRGFRTSSMSGNLPVWGGSITFNNTGSINWHFDHTTVAPFGTFDFYSIALHEVGHALGLATTWDDWEANSAGGFFTGANALAAYNADNGTALTSLEVVSTGNQHWEEDVYDSFIFEAATPNLTGTVGLGVLQDLLMEPEADFLSPIRQRFELTNVDVAALEDLGWSVISGPTDPADFDTDGDVDAADLSIWETNYGLNALADADGDGSTTGRDFLVWQRNYTGSLPTIAAVPEPSTTILALFGLIGCGGRRRR